MLFKNKLSKGILTHMLQIENIFKWYSFTFRAAISLYETVSLMKQLMIYDLPRARLFK